MLLYIVDGVETALWLILGVLASYTDLRSGKVYNKHLIFFLLSGVGILILRLCVDDEYLKIWSLTLGIGVVLAVFLYAVRVWAAGDAKLYSTLLLLIPPRWTEWSHTGVPGFSIAITIFILGYVYLLLETIYLLVKKAIQPDVKGKSWRFLQNNSRYSLNKVILRFYLSFSVAGLIQSLLFYTIPKFYLPYRQGFILVQVFILMAIMNRMNTWKNRTLFMAATLCFILYQSFTFTRAGIIGVHSLTPLLVVILVAAARLIGQPYNYQFVFIENVRAGMILSFDTIMEFYGSRVKGLPSSTTESTRSRLSEEEVRSIKRWALTKRGNNQIRIVRHLPFAPFIVLGMLLQVLYGLTKIM